MRKLLNHRFILTVLLLSIGVFSHAQETGLNERHLEYNTAMIYGGVLSADDSTFFVVGATRDSVEFNDIGIIRAFDYNGDEKWRIELSDSLDYVYFDWNNLIRNMDSSFSVLGGYDKYYHFTKFNKYGDTVLTKTITDLWDNDSVTYVRSGTLIQDVQDSSIYSLITVQSDMGGLSSFIHLSDTGNLLDYKFFSPLGIYENVIHGDICQLNDSTLVIGLLKTAFSNGPWQDKVRTNEIVFMDNQGNEYFSWIDNDNQYGHRIIKIFPLLDGGLIFVRIQGEYFSNGNGIKYKGNVVKLDANLQEVWDTKFGYRHAGTNVEDAMMLADSSIIVVGSQYAQIDEDPNNQIYGWMVKLDKNGTVLWERRYFNVSYDEDPLNNKNYLRAIDQLPNGGFVAVGEARHGTNIMNNIPGQFGWLITTDSLGCIVPGCQYLSSEDPEMAPAFKMYPNPANEKVNIFYDGKASGTLIIRDMNGKEVKTVPVGSDAVTYIIPVNHLSSGVYSVVIESGGKVVVKEKLVKE